MAPCFCDSVFCLRNQRHIFWFNYNSCFSLAGTINIVGMFVLHSHLYFFIYIFYFFLEKRKQKSCIIFEYFLGGLKQSTLYCSYWNMNTVKTTAHNALHLPTMNNDWMLLVGVATFDSRMIAYQTRGVDWGSSVRPCRKVVVVHQSLFLALTSESNCLLRSNNVFDPKYLHSR